MTRSELPPRAVNIVDAVSRATCTDVTVKTLEQIFDFDGSRTSVKAKQSTDARRPQATLRVSRPTGHKTRKQPPVTVLEDPTDAAPLETSREKRKLATEIINTSLKVLAAAVQSPPTKSAGRLSRSILHQSPPSDSVSELHTPLRALSLNRVVNTSDEKCRRRRSSSTSLRAHLSGLQAAAECGSLAFAILGSVDAQESLGTHVAPLQLEHGLSVFIGKLVALDFHDIAIKELRVLRRRLNAPKPPSEQKKEKARPASRIHSGPLSGTGKESLPDLLTFRNTNAKGQLLDLMITTQFQVLRIIAKGSSSHALEAAIKHLDLCAPSSPANLIERQRDELSPQRSTKAAHQLESLSRLLSQFCGGVEPSEQHQDSGSRRNLCPSVAFRYQVLALEIRLRWWSIARHQGDAIHEILRPFENYLAYFQRRAALSEEEKYTFGQAQTARLLIQLSEHRDEAIMSADNVQKAMFKLRLIQADLAREHSKFDVANDYLNMLQQSAVISNASKSQICLFRCKRATLSVRTHMEFQRQQQMLEEMMDLSVILGQDLGEDDEEFIEIVMALNDFRKSVLTLVRRLQQKPVSTNQTDLHITTHCAKALCSGVNLLSAVPIKSQRQDTGGRAGLLRPSRWQLVWDVANTFIESVAMLAKLSIACTAENWNTIHAGLQCSISLAYGSIDSYYTKPPKAQGVDVKISCFITISNAYWCRFLQVKQTSADYSELRDLLTASIDAVRDQPTLVQQSALLPAKLEKLASLHESSKNYVKAAAAHAEVIKSLAANGTVSAAAEAARRESLQLVLNKTGPFSLLGRSIRGYQKAIICDDDGAPPSRLKFDIEELSSSERGLMLEYQLATTVSAVASGGCSVKALQMINELALTLLSIYTSELPIRRLRVTTELMHFKLCQPSASLEVDKQVVQECERKDHSSYLGHDVGLQQYSAHLGASRDIYTVLYGKWADSERLNRTERALAFWAEMVQECHDLPTLGARVDNIEDWKSQLGNLVHYLELEGREHQRLLGLNLLTRLHELGSPVQASLISTLSALGSQYVRLGFSAHAGLAFQRAQKFMSKIAISTPVEIGWHLAYADYLLSIGSCDKSESHLIIARDLFHGFDRKSVPGRQAIQLVANAASVYAQLSSARGEFYNALLYCRLRVKLLHCVWSRSENQGSGPSDKAPPRQVTNEIEKLTDSITSLSISQSSLPTTSSTKATKGNSSQTCSLVPQLFDALANLAELYAHEGLISESQYYMEQSAKVARNAGSSFQSQNHAQSALYLIRGGDVEKAKSHLNQAGAMGRTTEPIRLLVTLQMALAERYEKSDEPQMAMSALALAISELENMMQTDHIDRFGGKPWHSTVTDVHNFSAVETSPPTNSKIRGQTKLTTSGKSASVAQASSNMSAKSRQSHCVALHRMRSRLLRHQASIALRVVDFDRVEDLVKESMQSTSTPRERIASTMVTAKLATRRALANMATDLVFCVIPESTMCCPSITPTSNHREDSSEDCPMKIEDRSVPQRGKPNRVNGRVTKSVRTPALPEFVELLRKARDDLNKIRSLTVSSGSTVDLHILVDELMKALMMLSAFPSSRATHMQSPLFAMYVMEIGRIVAMVKQRQALRVERQLSLAPIAADWPEDDLDHVAPLGEIISSDIGNFQSEYLDIIPDTWTVISLGLSDSHDEIRISKFRSGRGPFILNLPLTRHSQDGDEEVFGFEQGKTELRDIIALANYSTQDAPDISRKGARTAWWDTRAALDARLKDLVVNIETIWFGGFRGIFGPDPGSQELLSRFQQSLHNILDKYLPSRHKQTKNKKQNRVLLNAHVLELFVALGNPGERDLDEILIDLLYFVIDILQFHGERNAYDEVDFDAITVEVLDALRQYHEAAKDQQHAAKSQHTILILDKALHGFPWESMPCLKGQAVSRLPSLGCLRDRILQQTRQQQPGLASSKATMLSANRNNGTYVINPSEDLTATQSRFEGSLEKLSEWDAVVKREPSQAEVKTALESKDIFLYFGHGSGSQYIRPRTFKKLDQCAIALLMGCSSGALTEAGDYESYGTPIDYMHAGSPAVLATLWDVTDKDIDRFSQTVLEKWGLFEEPKHDITSSPVKKGTKSRGKSKVKSATSAENERRSLDQAVAEARDCCIMKYLNGAAPVIYGVPVMLS